MLFLHDFTPPHPYLTTSTIFPIMIRGLNFRIEKIPHYVFDDLNVFVIECGFNLALVLNVTEIIQCTCNMEYI